MLVRALQPLSLFAHFLRLFSDVHVNEDALHRAEAHFFIELSLRPAEGFHELDFESPQRHLLARA